VYAYWGAALSLLLALGLVCWFFVYPLLQTRSALRYFYDANMLTGGMRRDVSEQSVKETIRRLGGRYQAVGRIRLYMKLSDRLAPEKGLAMLFLYHLDPEAMPLLVELTEHRDKDLRRLAVQGVAAFSDSRELVLQTLMSALKDEDKDARRDAASMLAEVKPAAEEAVPALVGVLLRDSSEAVRDAALVALDRIAGTSSSRPMSAAKDTRYLLKVMAEDDNPKIRAAARKGLAELNKEKTPQ